MLPWATSSTKKSIQGHNALGKAALWLDNDRGSRKPGQEMGQLTSRVVRVKDSKESVGSRAGSKLPQSARTSSKKITANPNKAGFDSICAAIAEKASQKFKNTRQAFRFIDEDHDGTISRTEMRYFFRAYDFAPPVADAFFDFLDPEGNEEIDYETFVGFMSPHFNDVRPGSPTLAGKSTEKFEEKPPELPEENVRRAHEDFKDLLQVIGNKVPTKFPSLRHCWRYVDNDHDGKVSRSELRSFFRAFNLEQGLADNLYDRMVSDCSGEIFYEHFIRYLGPFVAPDATEVSSILKTPKRSTAIVTSPKDPQIMKSWAQDTNLHSPKRGNSPKVLSPDKDPEVRDELKMLMIDIGRKLPLKFKAPRDAFRMLDLQRDGRITRSEMRGFFRGFGWNDQVADRMFDLLKEEATGGVDFKSFMSHFDKMVGPQFRVATRKPMIEVEDKNIEKEINDIAAIVQDRLTTKYKTVADAFRAIDLNKDGTVCQFEMRMLFRNCGLSYGQADKVFAAMDADGSGEIQFDEFVSLFGMQRSAENLEKERSQPLWKIYGGTALCI
jgi:Ca2+-binding EF-hand superfamily protein